MIINSLTFKNIKSYGNKIQKLEFDTEGSLILLTGTNGAGKSTIQDSIDLALFNQVRGKYTNKIPLKYFPNRLNKDLMVGIDFLNSDNDNIVIERTIQPTTFTIIKNTEPFTEHFKVLTEEAKENVIGFNYDTFKSFISLSMNDFMNFIKLTPESKKNLTNKLFNLEDIDMYFSINDELISQTKNEIEKLTLDILNNDKILIKYKDIINKERSINKQLTKDELKKSILSEKKNYLSMKIELQSISDKISNFDIKIQEFRKCITNVENDNIKKRTILNGIRDNINIYKDDKCPYCMSDLNDSKHKNMLNELNCKDKQLNDDIISNNDKILQYKVDIQTNTSQKSILQVSFNELMEEYNKLKKTLIIIKDKIDNYKVSEDNSVIENLKVNGILLIAEKKEKLKKISELKLELSGMKKLRGILSETGVRKELIASLVPPINESLTTMLDDVDFPYHVQLDSNFDAVITERGEEVYSEIISNGEQRILNVCIAISYIEMVRKINDINILFMDEVFQSIHKNNIELILKILKKFSKKNKLNLILVHHGLDELDSKLFDRVISVEKDLFSDIKDVYLK